MPNIVVVVNEINRDGQAEVTPLLVEPKSERPHSPLVIGVPVEFGLRPPACAPLDCCGATGWFGSPAPHADPAVLSGLRKQALQLAILLAVMLQNSGYALLRGYSRGTLKERYSSSSVLLAMELVKLVFCGWKVVTSDAPSDTPAGSPLAKYAHLLRRSLKMAVPALIYLLMNILSFVALGRIDAATFSIVSQLKVLTTASFSVALLGRSLHARKWRALFTLTLGVVLISAETKPRAAPGEAAASEWAIGMGAVLAEVLLSGFGSVYFERVLKSSDETYSVWDRNFQLACWSILIYAPLTLRENPADPLAGWSWIAAACALVGALGGLLVALSLKYADSVTKTIATTGAIVLSTLLNASLLEGPFSLSIAVGTMIVVASVFSYSDNG